VSIGASFATGSGRLAEARLFPEAAAVERHPYLALDARHEADRDESVDREIGERLVLRKEGGQERAVFVALRERLHVALAGEGVRGERQARLGGRAVEEARREVALAPVIAELSVGVKAQPHEDGLRRRARIHGARAGEHEAVRPERRVLALHRP
jgi:hypothetical protein